MYISACEYFFTPLMMAIIKISILIAISLNSWEPSAFAHAPVGMRDPCGTVQDNWLLPCRLVLGAMTRTPHNTRTSIPASFPVEPQVCLIWELRELVPKEQTPPPTHPPTQPLTYLPYLPTYLGTLLVPSHAVADTAPTHPTDFPPYFFLSSTSCPSSTAGPAGDSGKGTTSGRHPSLRSRLSSFDSHDQHRCSDSSAPTCRAT